ncbi:hypothetical protein, partial [Pseudomonas syringae group genomosp. 7]|uniref:hypothetical protein n=1 Tax=Pseudomonas syringae group genomosp. 7 TaxID=251699 RepID=UPI00376F9D3D
FSFFFVFSFSLVFVSLLVCLGLAFVVSFLSALYVLSFSAPARPPPPCRIFINYISQRCH